MLSKSGYLLSWNPTKHFSKIMGYDKGKGSSLLKKHAQGLQAVDYEQTWNWFLFLVFSPAVDFSPGSLCGSILSDENAREEVVNLWWGNV